MPYLVWVYVHNLNPTQRNPSWRLQKVYWGIKETPDWIIFYLSRDHSNLVEYVDTEYVEYLVNIKKHIKNDSFSRIFLDLIEDQVADIFAKVLSREHFK